MVQRMAQSLALTADKDAIFTLGWDVANECVCWPCHIAHSLFSREKVLASRGMEGKYGLTCKCQRMRGVLLSVLLWKNARSSLKDKLLLQRKSAIVLEVCVLSHVKQVDTASESLCLPPHPQPNVGASYMDVVHLT